MANSRRRPRHLQSFARGPSLFLARGCGRQRCSGVRQEPGCGSCSGTAGGVSLEIHPNEKTPLCAFASQMFVIRLHRLNCQSADGYITAEVGSSKIHAIFQVSALSLNLTLTSSLHSCCVLLALGNTMFLCCCHLLFERWCCVVEC